MNPTLMGSSCPVSHFLLVQQQWMGNSPPPPPPNAPAAEPSIEKAKTTAAGARHHSNEAPQFVPPSSSRASSTSSALWDVVPGAVGGFCSVVVGHPLDLLKVRMQAGPSASAQLSSAPGGSPSLPSHHHLRAHHRQMTTTASGPWWHRPSRSWQNNRLLLSSLAHGASRAGHLGVWNTGSSQTIQWGMAASGAVRRGGVSTISAFGGVAEVARAPAVVKSSPPTSIRGMAMDVVRQNGIRGLYAGMTAPLVAVVPAFGVTIWSFEAAKRQLLLRRPEGRDPPAVSQQQQQLTVAEAALAGAASGVFAAFVLGPLEKIKCEFQLHPHRYRSFLDCVRVQIAGGGPQPLSPPLPRLISWSLSNPYAAQQPGLSFPAVGRVRDLFRGTILTVCRDVPGNAMYFAVYESVRRTLLSNACQHETDDRSSSSRRRLMATALAGGIAGVANWCLCLPIDAVKTRWQTAPAGTYSGPLEVLRVMLREGSNHQVGSQGRTGISALYRGLGPAVLRAFPANAVALCAVDLTRQALGMPTL